MKWPPLTFRGDGRIEWVCEHGIGHTCWTPENDWTHGCDGCCNCDEYEKTRKELDGRVTTKKSFIVDLYEEK